MTPQEIQALFKLLERTPMSDAEALFVQAVYRRLTQQPTPEPPKEDA